LCLAWGQELHERGIHPTTRFCCRHTFLSFIPRARRARRQRTRPVPMTG
jgi:hypothetical protein